MRIAVIFLCLLAMAAGCAESPGPRMGDDETGKGQSCDFRGKTRGDVLDAAARICRAASKTGVGFYSWPNGMICQRKYKTLGMLRTSGGVFDFRMTVEEEDGATGMTLRISQRESSATDAVMPAESGNRPVDIYARNPARVVMLPGAYRLFFDRMRSLLYGEPWVTCREAAHDPRYGGGLDALCLGADDGVP